MAVLPEAINHLTDAIYRAYEARSERERTYLGMSTLGNECDRALWYSFRWSSPKEKFDGRKLRLFQTGHREEERLLDDLRSIGVEVQERDPATGRQWEVTDESGFVRGHLDAVAIGIPDAPKSEHVIECKTHNDKSFKDLTKNGVEKSKPGHYAQIMLYMHNKGIHRALYIAVNKNDDSIYTERVKYDAALAVRLMARVERIVRNIDTAPPKLHDDPTSRAAWVCGWCPSLGVCHEGQMARRNCRTCLSSDFRPGAVVHCELHNKDLTYDEQQRGCDAHRYLPALTPGEVLDADEAARTVTYKLANGETWVDEGK